jgi:hypothetical protein
VTSVVYESCWIFIEKSIFSFKYAVSSPSLFLIDPVFFCGWESFSIRSLGLLVGAGSN